MESVLSKEITITCADHYPLAATLYLPAKTPKAAVMIAPATGIKRQFYRNFAQYLSENGYGVITFDNRGIGASLLGDIKKSEASLQCWGEQDMPAVLSELQQQFPDTTYHLVGHSAGGQLIGLMPNALAIKSQFNFACSSGRLKNMRASYKIKAHFFMNIFIPLNNTIFGYTNSQWAGMGEPLPKQVAEQWRLWCNGQGYVKTAFNRTIKKHLYDELTLPSMWVNASDDEIANNQNVADMLSVFSKLNAATLTLNPKDFQLDEIGHMKFFSRKCNKLWPIALSWLNEHI
jgi:predicted alpha/beta hydrolase